MNKFIRLLINPGFRFDILISRNLLPWMSDEEILRKRYFYAFNRYPDFRDPKTFTEKLQWLKLYDRRAEYTTMVDKAEAKRIAADIIGSKYVVPTYGIWDSFDEIDFDALPEQFVLKCTHDSGGLVIVKDKAVLDKRAARLKIGKCMKRNYYYLGREWPYKNVKPQILAEQLLENKEDGSINDYKFFTFGGIPKLMYITQGKREDQNVTADFFDMDGNHLDMKMDHENSPVPPALPKNFILMQELAAKLAKGTPHLRVDFYEVDGQVYFGEMTFFHCGGMVPVYPEKWNRLMGDWIELPGTDEDQ